MSIPASELERRLSELPQDREIVAYCRGPYCVLAFRAVEVLRTPAIERGGWRWGYPRWHARGHAVVKAARGSDRGGES